MCSSDLILVRLREGEGIAAILEEAKIINLSIKTVEEYHVIGGYHIHTLETLARAIASVVEADSFESCLRNVIYIGSDDDTTAAVAGPMAELLFGIPENIVMETLNLYMIRHIGIPKAIAEFYKDLEHWHLSEAAMQLQRNWIKKTLDFVPVDYTRSDNLIFGRDIFSIETITNITGFHRVSFVKQSYLQLAKPAENVAVISIRDEDRWQTTLEGWGALLNINFYDVDDNDTKLIERIISNFNYSEKVMNKISRIYSGKYWPWRPIFKCDADKIAAFIVKAHQDGIKELVVACDYGRSR